MGDGFGSRLPRRRFLRFAAGASAAVGLRSLLPGPMSYLGPGTWELGLATAAVRESLPNGLVVVVDERRAANTVAFQLTARAGSRDDRDQPGSTLLTSRLMFQGTSRRPSETELQRAAAQVGGTLSRGTTVESSWFTSLVPSYEVDVAFDLLSDLVLDPLFDAGALERQKRIALQELIQRRANPSILVDDLFQTTIFAGHPASGSILGTPESLRAITRDGLLEARGRLWGAANLVLTIVGRIPTEEALAAARRSFGTVPPGRTNQRAPTPPEPIESPRTVRSDAGEQQIEFRLGFPAPPLLDPDRYPLIVLNALMTGSSGRLSRELRGARGVAYVAGSVYTAYTDAGAWFATAGVDPENLEMALQVVRAEIETARRAPPDPAEVARKLTQIAGRQILADETNAARASRLAAQEVLGTEPTEEFVRRIRQVTPADVHRVAQAYLDSSRAVLVVVGPGRLAPAEE